MVRQQDMSSYPLSIACVEAANKHIGNGANEEDDGWGLKCLSHGSAIYDEEEPYVTMLP